MLIICGEHPQEQREISNWNRLWKDDDLCSGGTREAVLPAPGKPYDGEIVVQALLLNPAEIIPKIAESKKKTQPHALIAVAILFQNLFNIHGDLL
jgi:hypothetical protein